MTDMPTPTQAQEDIRKAALVNEVMASLAEKFGPEVAGDPEFQRLAQQVAARVHELLPMNTHDGQVLAAARQALAQLESDRLTLKANGLDYRDGVMANLPDQTAKVLRRHRNF